MPYLVPLNGPSCGTNELPRLFYLFKAAQYLNSGYFRSHLRHIARHTPRPGFTKATVSAWRVSLEDRRLGSSSIIIRMSAIRKLAAEAADNGLLAPELAAGSPG